MNFRRGSFQEEPEINLVPFIDVLIVIVIFLAITTTYSKYSELQINLPTADASKAPERTEQIDVAVDAQGKYLINKSPVVFSGADGFSQELRRAAGDRKDPIVVISADANSPHQSVINVMEAARIAGYGKITFTTQAGNK